MSPSPYTAAIQSALYQGGRPTLLPVDEPANATAVAFDPNVARRSYERFAAAWSKMPSVGLRVPSVDIDYVVPRVVQRAREIQSPAMRERFARLPEFDLGCYDDLEATAWAVWYCQHQRASQRHARSEAKVPLPLWKQAEALDEKMVRVLEYNAVAEDDPEDAVALGIASLKLHEGNRYEKTSHRLLGLAALYEDPKVAALLGVDRKRYDPADATHARGLSAQIVMALNAERPSDSFWDAQLMRSWVALDRCYGQVRRGMHFLDAEHGAEERFVKLAAIVRPRRTEAPKAPGPTPAEGATPPAKKASRKKAKKDAAPANNAPAPTPAAPSPPAPAPAPAAPVA